MHRFFLALFLASVPVSIGALAHSGTDQDEKVCTRDVQRFCRKLMDQGDFTILPQGKPSKADARVPHRDAQPRAMQPIDRTRAVMP
jgi:hypothetical protein